MIITIAGVNTNTHRILTTQNGRRTELLPCLLPHSLHSRSHGTLQHPNVTHANIERHANQHRSAPKNRKNRTRNNIQNQKQNRRRKQKLIASLLKNFFCTQRTPSNPRDHHCIIHVRHIWNHSAVCLHSQEKNQTDARMGILNS